MNSDLRRRTTNPKYKSVDNGARITAYKEQSEHAKWQKTIFGFAFHELTSWQSLVRLLCRPTDPAALGVLRFLYGMLLLIDTLEERGMGQKAYKRWSPDMCHAPLFDFIKPLPVAWMFLLYFVMLLATVGITLGLMYRWSLLIFNTIYWYIFFLDKSVWNNHSYLFGLIAFLLLLSDGNRYWSVDCVIWPELKNQEVPLWNYTLLRFQVFILYFLAGIKKLDPEWMYGWSQRDLGNNWVFGILRPFLTTNQITLYIVHWVGCLLDLTLGYLLFFDKTRGVGLVIGWLFHAMNSQIYFIGMFPFMGMATMTIFCYPDWPRKILWRTPTVTRNCSSHCLYDKQDIKPEVQSEDTTLSRPANRNGSERSTDKTAQPSTYHVLSTAFVILYIAEQLFLPFSFGIFKGLHTGWGGLYGYTWNMMIYRADPSIQIYVRDIETGETTDISQMVSTKNTHVRWAFNPRMLLQFTDCIAQQMDSDGAITGEFAITYDIWLKVNNGIRQRLYDPEQNMLTAKWSLFSKTEWQFPLMPDHWEIRNTIVELHRRLNTTAFSFRADFPGYTYEIHPRNRTGFAIRLMKGTVIVEEPVAQKNITMEGEEYLVLPPAELYRVHTISDQPSYASTEVPFDDKYGRYKKAIEARDNGEDPEGHLMKEFHKNDKLTHMLNKVMADEKVAKKNPFGTGWSRDGFYCFITERLFLLKHGLNEADYLNGRGISEVNYNWLTCCPYIVTRMYYTLAAIRSILGGMPFDQYVQESIFGNT